MLLPSHRHRSALTQETRIPWEHYLMCWAETRKQAEIQETWDTNYTASRKGGHYQGGWLVTCLKEHWETKALLNQLSQFGWPTIWIPVAFGSWTQIHHFKSIQTSHCRPQHQDSRPILQTSAVLLYDARTAMYYDAYLHCNAWVHSAF